MRKSHDYDQKKFLFIKKYVRGDVKVKLTNEQKNSMLLFCLQGLKILEDEAAFSIDFLKNSCSDYRVFLSGIKKLNLMPQYFMHKTLSKEDFERLLHTEHFEKIMNGDKVKCVVCEQNSKVYKRKLNANMCKFLWSLNASKDLNRSIGRKDGDWVHYKDLKFTSRDYSYVTHWGLAIMKTNNDDSKRTSGYWKITDLGSDFVENETRVPKYCYIYNGRFVSKSNETITFNEATKDKWDWREVYRNCNE